MKTVVPGDRGLAVSDVQKRLLDRGFAPPGFEAEMRESFFGDITSQAVRLFQEERGLRVQGSVDETTWQELVEASFKLGDRFLYLRVPPFRGDDVREVQRYLNRLGFNAGREDGIFGQDTDRALRAFQHNMALPVDGIAGASTIACLQRLRHALKDTSVAEVHEALQDLQARGLEGKSVVLDAAEGDSGAENVLRQVSAELVARGLTALLTGGVYGPMPESQRARLANDRGADLVLSLRMTDEPGFRVFFFGSRDYSSPRGKRLAELIHGEMEQGAGVEVPPPEARNFPLLRETRMPCVIVETGWETGIGHDLFVALARSVIAYFTPAP
ncbi:MAG: peptidoglycan-binding protein [Actinomycetota bacterium]